MPCHQIGSLVASLALAIPYVQNCDPDVGPTVDVEEDEGGGDLPEGDQPCCEVSDEPACDEPKIVKCVCARDEYCCANEWDPTCVGEADEFCDASCGL